MPLRLLLAAAFALVSLLSSWPAAASPLGIDFGFCEPVATEDPGSDWLQKEATFGRWPFTRKLEVHYRYTVPSAGADKQALIDQTDEVRLCYVNKLGMYYFCPFDWIIYRRFLPWGSEPTPSDVSVHEPWVGGEQYDPGDLPGHKRFIIDGDWLDPDSEGTVLFFRINDQDVDQALHENGFCPLPYPLHETPDGRFRFYGVKEGTRNVRLDRINLDLCGAHSTLRPPTRDGVACGDARIGIARAGSASIA